MIYQVNTKNPFIDLEPLHEAICRSSPEWTLPSWHDEFENETWVSYKKCGKNVLVVTPAFAWLLSSIPVLIGVGWLSLILTTDAASEVPQWIFWLCGVVAPAVFIAGGLMMFLNSGSLRFDLRAGQMMYRTMWSRWQRPLDDVAGILVIQDGLHRFFSVNLVLAKRRLTLMILSKNGNREWTRHRAKELAGFLKVPYMEVLRANDAVTNSSRLVT